MHLPVCYSAHTQYVTQQQVQAPLLLPQVSGALGEPGGRRLIQGVTAILAEPNCVSRVWRTDRQAGSD